MAGAALCGGLGDQLVHVLYGGGANGKTTFTETIRAVLGDYAAHAPAELFLLDRYRHGPAPELLHLRGRRLVTAAETGAGRRLDETLVKQLSGGDTITARGLYQSELVEFRPAFAIWLWTNHKPVVDEQSEAIWRRLRLVPFTITIPAEERDAGLGERLRAEELQGILAWCVAGCLAWREQGLEPPEAIRTATAEYRAEEDVLGAFIADRCRTGPDCSAESAALFAAWKEWATSNGHNPSSETMLGRRLSEAGYPGGKRSGKRVRVGLELAEQQRMEDL
jgi:putative DNA primase/helicase